MKRPVYPQLAPAPRCWLQTLLASWLCLSLLWLSGCSALRPEFREPDVQVKAFQKLPGSNLLDQRFALLLELQNPNDYALDVKGLRFRFDVGEVELMRGLSDEIPPIPAYGTVRFTVQGSANLVQAVRLLQQMQRQPDDTNNYRLVLDVDLAKGWPSTFTVTRRGEFALQDWLGKR